MFNNYSTMFKLYTIVFAIVFLGAIVSADYVQDLFMTSQSQGTYTFWSQPPLSGWYPQYTSRYVGGNALTSKIQYDAPNNIRRWTLNVTNNQYADLSYTSQGAYVDLSNLGQIIVDIRLLDSGNHGSIELYIIDYYNNQWYDIIPLNNVPVLGNGAKLKFVIPASWNLSMTTRVRFLVKSTTLMRAYITSIGR